MVSSIEEFGTELKVYLFAHWKLLDEREVPALKSRTVLDLKDRGPND
jgi:hypothetical protein